MGKLKLSNYKNNYPLPPNTFKLCIELSGESIKLISDDDKEIKIKIRKNFNYHRAITEIQYACDLLLDAIELNQIWTTAKKT